MNTFFRKNARLSIQGYLRLCILCVLKTGYLSLFKMPEKVSNNTVAYSQNSADGALVYYNFITLKHLYSAH